MRRKRSPDEAMTLVEHLEELRYRLIVCLAALLPALVAGWYLAPRLLTHLRRPAEAYGAQLTQLAPGEVLWVYLKLTLIAGIVLASPVLLYQL
ncbi:MAG: twin-arginine translocase subunit TatC, partial [Clostridia bacterium]|nr:twin-arginine translocase subunit TatC [Clostridia bacterium]